MKKNILTTFVIFVFAICNMQMFASESAPALELKSHDGEQNERIVTGLVTDGSGDPLLGATVAVEGTSSGVVTDLDGRFTIKMKDQESKLVISYIGFKTTTIDVKGRSQIEVMLKEDSRLMDEVVVIGYGVSKRRDLIGAVEQIGGDALRDKPHMNVARSLQGAMPGLNISMRDGKPGRSGTIDLRGAQSIGAGKSEPLILIDGVDAHGDITTVSPADIESISILKDASSSAIYGSRGAFGVILITTKKASKGKAKVTYNGSVSAHQRLYEPEIVTNGLQWTNGFLASYAGYRGDDIRPTSINNVFSFNEEWYEELKRRDADPSLEKMRVNSKGLYEYFGNTNWFDVLYKDWTMSTEHNVSVSGGNDGANYYVSGRYFNQDGIYNDVKEDYTQYNFRAKGQVKLNKHFTLDNNTDFIRRINTQPMVMYDRQNILRQIEHQGYPMTLPQNLDGTWTESSVYTGWAGFVEGTSFQKNKKMDLKNTTTLTYKPISEVILKADFSYYYNHSERTRGENQYRYYNGPEVSDVRHKFSSVEEYNYKNEYMASNITGNYIPNFNNKDHSLNILGGWNIEKRTTTNTRAYRRGLMFSEKPSLGLADGDIVEVGHTGNDWSYVGFMFRANYSFKGRYLAEFSGRYDGSSKFPESSKWGFFPSGSIGWRISEESFMKGTRGWLESLKVRASIGSLGNNNVEPYKYLPIMNVSRSSALIDGSQQVIIAPPNLIPDNLTWETNTTYGIGLDADFLNNRLNFVADYYRRNTTDMFTVGPTLPAVIGVKEPYGNYADMKTKGWELSLQWRDEFDVADKPFSYSVKAMIWDSRSWITKFNNPTQKLSDFYEGMELGEIWGYQIDGLFRSQEEIDGHADQSKLRPSLVGKLEPGDLKFADLDKSGKIDDGANTVGNPGDRKIIGNTEARYRYGVNLSANWSGFGVSAFFQGVGRQHWYPRQETSFFWGQYNRPYGYMLQSHTGNNVYTDENQNFDAYWPKYRGYIAASASKTMSVTNNRYLQNVAYLRLKTLQVDYTFDQAICKKMGLGGLRVYVTGDNIFTWSPLFDTTKNFDPENIHAGDSDFRSTAGVDGDGYGYPMLRTFTFGLNVTF